MARTDDPSEILEQGDIYFFYRPKVTDEGEEPQIDALADVQRAFVVLSPDGDAPYRLIALGRKRLPEIDESERNWGFVEAVECEPKRQQARFEERRFIPVDPPDFLDHEGAELLFVGAGEDVSGQLGLEFDPDDETERTAEIFRDLRLTRSERPVTPLLEGDWA